MRLVNCLVCTLALSAVAMLLPSKLSAGVPAVMLYQGHVTDPAGDPINGVHDITFTIYDSKISDTGVWTETHTGVSIENGLFTVYLGSVELLFAYVISLTPNRYLGIKIDDNPEMDVFVAFLNIRPLHF